MQQYLEKNSDVIADEWKATPGAVAGAGSNLRGTVNHSKNWRNPETGYHSNDIESEFARFKLFLRTKYDWVRATNNKNPVLKDLALERKMAEYVFYTNVGRTMAHVMEAFRYSGGY